MASSYEIETHHRILEGQIADAIGTKDLALVEKGEYKDWKSASWPHTVFFELKKGTFHEKNEAVDDQDDIKVKTFVQDYDQPIASREKGGAATVFEICTLRKKVSVWASWSEEWRSYALANYGLVGGGWSFFYRVNHEPFTQLFRAEWDQLQLPDGSTGRGGTAGQPHWHVDLRAEVLYETEEMLPTVSPSTNFLMELDPGSALQSLDTCKVSKINSLDRSGVHFAMGASESWGWQRQVHTDLALFRNWSIAVLRYVKEEAVHLTLD